MRDEISSMCATWRGPLIALALRGQRRHVYHIGTGESHRVGEGLDLLIKLSGRKVNLHVDPSLGNRHGPADSRADISRIVGHTGWQPRVSWQESLADLWRETAQRDRPIVSRQESSVQPAEVNHAA